MQVFLLGVYENSAVFGALPELAEIIAEIVLIAQLFLDLLRSSASSHRRVGSWGLNKAGTSHGSKPTE
jgi:hypothetical protein